MRIRKSLVGLVAVTVIAAACSSTPADSPSATAPETAAPGESSAPAEEVTIQFVSGGPEEFPDEYWTQLIDFFEADNAGINVERLPAPDDDIDAYAKQLLSTGAFPDVIVNVSDQDLVPLGALQPFEIDDEVRRVQHYEATMIDGQLYKLSAALQPTSYIWYNKSQFEAAGITTAPATWDEFEAGMAALKQAGFVPFLTGGDWVPGHQYHNMAPGDVYGENPQWMQDRKAGTVTFKDSRWGDLLRDWAKWLDAGYFNEGALNDGYEQVVQNFLAGQGAMMPMSSFVIPEFEGAEIDFEIGVFLPPTRDGKPRVAGNFAAVGYSVSATTPNPDQAFAFARFMALDPRAHLATIETGRFLSDFDPAVTYPASSPLAETAMDLALGAEFVPTSDGAGDGRSIAGTFDAINEAVQRVLLGEDADTVLSDLDAWWDSQG